MKNSKISHLDENQEKKDVTPPQSAEIFTSRKHSMDYFTTDGVILRTGYRNKRDWYLLPTREMLDNGVDFLWKYYKGTDNASVSVNVTMNQELFHVTVRNSNYKNIPIFSDLKAMFDYDIRYGSKQDVHIISRSMLGDALKQILSLGYVLLHSCDDGTSFTNKQWEYPLIIRHNKKEWKIYLHIDKAGQIPHVKIEESPEEVAHSDTEIEVSLPVIDEVRNELDSRYIEQFFRKYSTLTTDISFKFRITGDIKYSHRTEGKTNAGPEPVTASRKDPQGITVDTDIPALHPIAAEKEWSNTDNIHSYKPDEFTSRIMNVHNKDSVSVFNTLITFREGTQIKKTAENQKSIAKLLADPDKDSKLEGYFHELKNALKPVYRLSLPYTNNTKKRKDALVNRLSKIYDIDKEKEPSYKLLRGYFEDVNGLVQYPFAIESLAIPLSNPTSAQTEIIGAVNYSISPKNTNFEGDFEGEYTFDKDGSRQNPKNVHEILQLLGFFDTHIGKKSKLPCIIVVNLITPRRDPIGYDKSTIDTQPFARDIVDSIRKVASNIQTFHGAGYRFQDVYDYSTARRHKNSRTRSVRELLLQFLVKERGLPT